MPTASTLFSRHQDERFFVHTIVDFLLIVRDRLQDRVGYFPPPILLFQIPDLPLEKIDPVVVDLLVETHFHEPELFRLCPPGIPGLDQLVTGYGRTDFPTEPKEGGYGKNDSNDLQDLHFIPPAVSPVPRGRDL
jgi:hypothetical protein